jgi:hypothetical protein
MKPGGATLATLADDSREWVHREQQKTIEFYQARLDAMMKAHGNKRLLIPEFSTVRASSRFHLPIPTLSDKCSLART